MRVGLASLGCAKNLVDSEVLLGLLKAAGCEITPDAAAADVIVVNTCGFIESAKQESIDTVLEMAELKQSGGVRAILMTGCLAQRYARELWAELPEVDAIVGPSEYPRIAEILAQVLRGERVMAVGKPGFVGTAAFERVRTDAGFSTYLKIAEGCNHRCAFCAIPAMRGSYHSRSIEDVVAEARRLVQNGSKELVLIAQDTSAYGRDLYGELSLSALLRNLGDLPGLAWLRVLYCYPRYIDSRLIATLAEQPKVCKYLDIPLQHASDRLLKAMRRSGGSETYLRLVERLRRAVPGIVLRSTFIVGLPGETDKDFDELLAFIRECRFEHVGVFAYSPEEGTAAAAMDNQVPPELARERRDRLMRVQQEISYTHNQARVGAIETVLSLGPVARPDSPKIKAVGRSYREAPEIDGEILLDHPVPAGSFCSVRIERAMPYDVFGQVVELANDDGGDRR